MQDWEAECRARLSEHLDANDDIAPPWEKFPHDERYTIGWRMGMGEDWLGLWHVFLQQLEPSYEARLAYLRRHARAPVNWADAVHGVLIPSRDEDDDVDEDADSPAASERRDLLRSLGLIASDVAFQTWLAQQEGMTWPWACGDTPVEAARYRTRELWFWSRQTAALRSAPGWSLPVIPSAWDACASKLDDGTGSRRVSTGTPELLQVRVKSTPAIAPSQGLSANSPIVLVL